MAGPCICILSILNWFRERALIKSYLGEREKFCYVIEKDSHLIWWQGFHIDLAVYFFALRMSCRFDSLFRYFSPRVRSFWTDFEAFALESICSMHEISTDAQFILQHVRTKSTAMKTFKNTWKCSRFSNSQNLQRPPPSSFVETALEAWNSQNYGPRIENDGVYYPLVFLSKF